MKKSLFLTLGLALGLGVGVAAGLRAKSEAKEVGAALDTSSYTMNASELLGSVHSTERDDISFSLVDDSMRLTSKNGGQFFLVFTASNDLNIKDLADDCTSLTVKMRISDASKWNTVVYCQYFDTSSVESYEFQHIDLTNASHGFVNVTFDKKADTAYMGCVFSMLAKEVGAYVDFKSITFNGLTTFETRKFIKIQGDWNYWNRNNGTHSTLLEFDSTLAELSGGLDYSKQLGNKVTLNGIPFNNAGTIDHAHGGPYMQFTYVDTVMQATSAEYPNPVIEINDLIVFEKTFIEPVRIVFDSTEQKWHVEKLIEKDLLVRNSDYTLFTPSDYDFGGGHDGWFYYSKPDTPTPELTGHQSFGIQFTMQTISDGTGDFKLNFGSSITSDNFLLVYYESHRLYVGNFEGEANKYNVTTETMVNNLYLDDNEEHLIEVYCIKDTANTVVILCGIDGVLMFKTSSLSLEGAAEGNYFSLYDWKHNSDPDKLIIGSYSETDNIALDKFAQRRLHSEDISRSDNRETGNCTGADGYYAKAKTYYNTILNQSQRKAFATEASYADMRARFIAWAAASGENISLDVTTGAIIVANRNYLGAGVTNKNNLAIVIVVISISMLSMCTLAIILKKRKAHN